MKHSNFLIVLFLLAFPMIGCSGSDASAPVANPNEISDYVANNPDSDAATEPMGGDL